LHDLHHVLTEYDTTWTGEAEIGAWEIASGCGAYYAAWILNMGAFAIGLMIAPRLVYRAFIRGRKSRNLYKGTFNEELLSRYVGTVRQELNLDNRQSPASIKDNAAFLFWAMFSAIFAVAPYLLGLAIVILLLRWLF